MEALYARLSDRARRIATGRAYRTKTKEHDRDRAQCAVSTSDRANFLDNINSDLNRYMPGAGRSYAYHRGHNYVVSRSFTFTLGWAGPPCGLGLGVCRPV